MTPRASDDPGVVDDHQMVAVLVIGEFFAELVNTAL
jgi:hypothetical protein